MKTFDLATPFNVAVVPVNALLSETVVTGVAASVLVGLVGIVSPSGWRISSLKKQPNTNSVMTS
jgi:hypothetical protein